MTPFAAGCAICGADLEAARAARAARGARRPTLPPRLRWQLSLRGRGTVGPLHTGLDWTHLLIAVLVALAAPPFGLLLALFWAFIRWRDGETRMALAMAAVAALALTAFLAPFWFWSQLL